MSNDVLEFLQRVSCQHERRHLTKEWMYLDSAKYVVKCLDCQKKSEGRSEEEAIENFETLDGRIGIA